MTDILGKLFGSSARVKVLRLFLFNEGDVFLSKEVAKRINLSPETSKREVAALSHIGFIKKKTCFRNFSRKHGKKVIVTKKKSIGWTLDESFPYCTQLRFFLLRATPLTNIEISRRLSRIGKLELVIIAGVFIQNWDSRVDVLIVGNKLKQSRLKTAIRDMEVELGKELSVTVLSLGDFKYRVSVYDKLIRDILDYPHETVIDRIGVN